MRRHTNSSRQAFWCSLRCCLLRVPSLQLHLWDTLDTRLYSRAAHCCVARPLLPSCFSTDTRKTDLLQPCCLTRSLWAACIVPLCLLGVCLTAYVKVYCNYWRLRVSTILPFQRDLVSFSLQSRTWATVLPNQMPVGDRFPRFDSAP